MSESENNLKCVVCGIDDEEAIAMGIILEKSETIGDINIEKSVFRTSEVFGENTYMCSRCKSRFINMMKNKEYEDVGIEADKLIKFMKLSCDVMDIDEAALFEACMSICVEKLQKMMNKNPNSVAVVLRSFMRLFGSIQEEAERKIKKDKVADKHSDYSELEKLGGHCFHIGNKEMK